ncbi:MAG: hypothetical protein J6Y64_02180 [Ruminococcus sp.]|nr:hypothetical protein [Ruminococcus sp.]
MAISGSGDTPQDPYIVTTYDELVTAAAQSGKYVKIDNDINITDEYPDGDFSTLSVRADVDGNNKKISNWYRTNGNSGIYFDGGASQIRNLTIANIYNTSAAQFIDFHGGNSNYHFVNCKFHGVLYRPFFQAVDSYGSTYNFDKCSFYINSKYGGGAFVENNWSYIGMRDCNVKVIGTASHIFGTSRTTFIDSCYFETTMPPGVYDKFTNCVLDITTDTSFTANGSSGNALNIINSDHAPNATAGTGFALVDDEHWLDVAYLNRIGFNAG